MLTVSADGVGSSYGCAGGGRRLRSGPKLSVSCRLNLARRWLNVSASTVSYKEAVVGSKTGLGFGAGGGGASAGGCGVSRPEGIIGSSLGSATVGALDLDLVVTGDVGISKGGGGCAAGGPAMVDGGALGLVGAKLECAGEVGSYSLASNSATGSEVVGASGTSRRSR